MSEQKTFFFSIMVGTVQRVPSEPGTYKYMPFRSLGHYRLQEALKTSGPQPCYLMVGSNKLHFTVSRCPSYGKIELMDIHSENDGKLETPTRNTQVDRRRHSLGFLTPKNGAALLLGLAVGIGLLMVRLQVEHPLAMAQPASYHDFADKRPVLGLPNFWNVASNLPFALIGIGGMVSLFPGTGESHRAFIDQRERWPYLVLFVGLFLTAFGSAWYHFAPSNATLVWDRLPMAIMFAGFIAAVIAERIDVGFGVKLLPFLTLFSIGTVIQWYSSERHGHGDLRWYAALQIYSVLVLLLAPLLRPRYTRNWDFLIVFALYAVAKLFETFDRKVYSLGYFVSGHTLKHLAAAAAGYWILRMLQKRVPLQSEFIAH